MGRAGVDTAEYTQQMLKLARDQLEVSRQTLQGNTSKPTSFNTDGTQQKSDAESNLNKKRFENMSRIQTSENDSFAPMNQSTQPQDAIEHMGQQITLTDGRFTYDSKRFDSIDLAKQEIEKMHFMYEYQGMLIKARSGTYICNRKSFESFEAAKSYIDEYNRF